MQNNRVVYLPIKDKNCPWEFSKYLETFFKTQTYFKVMILSHRHLVLMLNLLGFIVFTHAKLLSHVRLFATLGSSVQGILQTRILEWVAMPSYRGIFPPQGSNPHLLCLLHQQMGCLSLALPRKTFAFHVTSVLRCVLLFATP